MYEQSFEYLANVILNYFRDIVPKPGERFHIQVEKEHQAKEIFDILALKAENKFSYNGYDTSALKLQKVKLIIASSYRVTESFLTRLRNQTANQKDKFVNSALLIIHHTSLDSILRGAEGLDKEGNPFHSDMIRSRIKTDIKKLSINKNVKKALFIVLDGFNSKNGNDCHTLFSYAPFMNIVQKGEIEIEDWNELGMFNDPELSDVDSKEKITNRIEENRKWFEKIQSSHRYGEQEEELTKSFSKRGIEELEKTETWMKKSFAQILKWHEERQNKKTLVYVESDISSTIDDGLVLWERGEGETATKKRRRHLIIFNSSHKGEIKCVLKFNKALKSNGVEAIKGPISANPSNRNLYLTIKNCNNETVIGRVNYGDDESNVRYGFSIAVLPFASHFLNNFRASFQIVVGKTSSVRLSLQSETSIVFNNAGSCEKQFRLPSNTPLHLSDETKVVGEIENESDDETIKFDLEYKGIKIPIEVSRDISKPLFINGLDIWKWKRERKQSFEYRDENKLIFGNSIFRINHERTHKFLKLERQIIIGNNEDCFWVETKDGVKPYTLDVDGELKRNFKELVDYYKKDDKLPSLTFIDNTLKSLMKKYVARYLKLLSDIEEKEILNEKTQNLLRIGIIECDDGEKQVYLTPLHPLNVAYQLIVYSECGEEEIPKEILKGMSPRDLLPFMNASGYQGGKLCPVLETELIEWTVYRPYNTLHKGWHNEYIQRLVAEKISEYVKHFPFLFCGSRESPIRVNLVNLGDGINALKGIVNYFKKMIKASKEKDQKIHHIALNIYNSQNGSNKFQEFALYSDHNKISKDFEVELKTKDIDPDDVLKEIREKLQIFIKKKDEPLTYAHLTFFMFDADAIQWTYHDMRKIKTGCALNGIVNAVPSVFSSQEYITGFGTQYLPDERNDLLNLALYLNALARVASTKDPYCVSEATFTAIRQDQKELLDDIYNKSNWVTFINPKVDLDFFKTTKAENDLIIIHYSDQYNNTSGYDAITVTRKSRQYRAIIREALYSWEIGHKEKDELMLINIFNAINGDWLLRLISERANFRREKISILSAVKTMLAILQHPDILWVPLSLEEILRVSGSAGLKKTEGLFSTKNLGAHGLHCDDLLMAGVERRKDQIHIHFLPVEVKNGDNQLNIMNKAKVQGERTADILRQHLSLDIGFKGKFYRNFFAKLVITAAEKMRIYDVFAEQDWGIIIEEYRAELLNSKYHINWELENVIGKAAVISFKSDAFIRKLYRENEYLMIEMFESDGRDNLLKDTIELVQQFQNPDTTIDERLLLINAYSSSNDNNSTNAILSNPVANDETRSPCDREGADINTVFSQPPIEDNYRPSADGMKILFGNNLNNTNPLYWYPNDTDKVMHTNTGIIGTMGTGKTQFTKSLITQLVRNSKDNVNGTQLGILIFDYKGDYVKEDFIKATGAKCYALDRLPYNPLALTVSEKFQPKLPLHTANAIKESISTAFRLGNVQQQTLRNCIMEAYENFEIDKSNPDTWSLQAPTLSDVCELYLNTEDVKCDSLYSAIDSLYQFEIFEPDSKKTKSLFELLEGVVVINLSGYDQNVQNLVVAITLDLFYSQMQKTGHSTIEGNLRELTKMVLVDEADNFLSQNFQSLRKILKEGREFGVGTILSTQFLNHFSTNDNEYSNYIMTWIVHRVTEISQREGNALFKPTSKEHCNEVLSTINGLKKHQSVANIGDGVPILIRDRAFWEIMSEVDSNNRN